MILGSYLPSYWRVWSLSGWGTYIVLNGVLSVLCTVTAFSVPARVRTGSLVLLGSTFASFLLDLYVIVGDFAAFINTNRSWVTLAVPVLFLHAYLLFILIKAFLSPRTQKL